MPRCVLVDITLSTSLLLDFLPYVSLCCAHYVNGSLCLFFVITFTLIFIHTLKCILCTTPMLFFILHGFYIIIYFKFYKMGKKETNFIMFNDFMKSDMRAIIGAWLNFVLLGLMTYYLRCIFMPQYVKKFTCFCS